MSRAVLTRPQRPQRREGNALGGILGDLVLVALALASAGFAFQTYLDLTRLDERHQELQRRHEETEKLLADSRATLAYAEARLGVGEPLGLEELKARMRTELAPFGSEDSYPKLVARLDAERRQQGERI